MDKVGESLLPEILWVEVFLETKWIAHLSGPSTEVVTSSGKSPMISKSSHPYWSGKHGSRWFRPWQLHGTTSAPVQCGQSLSVRAWAHYWTCAPVFSALYQVALYSLPHRVFIRIKSYFKCITFMIISDIWDVLKNYVQFLIARNLKYYMIFIPTYLLSIFKLWLPWHWRKGSFSIPTKSYPQ